MSYDLDCFLKSDDSKSIEEKKKIISEMVGILDSAQLSEVIDFLSEPYFMHRLNDYLVDDRMPDSQSAEFRFLLQAEKYNGNIVRKLINRAKINDYSLKKFIKKYQLREISGGVYVFPDKPIDGQFLFQLQYSNAIISHETALYLLGMSDVIPRKTIMSMPKSYNLSQIYHAKNAHSKYRSIYPLAESDGKSMDFVIEYFENDPIVMVRNDAIRASQKVTCYSACNNPVSVTSEERTIADILKTSARTEEEVKEEAIKRYFEKVHDNGTRLRRIAKQQSVLEELDRYLWHLRL